MDELNKNGNDYNSEPASTENTPETAAEPLEDPVSGISRNITDENPEIPTQIPQKNGGKKIYIPIVVLLILIFIMTAVLTVYFIYTDVRTGSIEFNKNTANNDTGYSLDIHDKPDKAEKSPEKDSSGKYTIEGLAEYIRPQIVEIYAYNSTAAQNGVSCGSGIIISEDGYIITNTHIIENGLSSLPTDSKNKPDSFVIITSDEKKYNAKIIGRDKKTDIAVVKIDASGLPYAEMGNSDETAVGEQVVAIGNPEGFNGSVTQGIVSGLNRKIKAESTSYEMNCIQTDAAISSGNSGGALVNMYGQVIGITSSKYITSTSEGLGFAISINEAKPIIEEIISKGYVSGRVRVGITFLSMDNATTAAEFKEKYKRDIPEKLRGLWITDVSPDCDISKTDLKADDFILKVNGEKIRNYDDLCAVIEGKKGGDTLKAQCARIDKDMNITYFDIEFKLMEDTSGDF